MFYATFISRFGTQLQKALKRYPFGRARSVHDQKAVSSYLLVSFQSLHCNDLFSNNNKVFSSAPHPSLRDTFAPQTKALTAVQLFIQKTSILYPFGGLPPRRARLGNYYIFNTYLVIGVSQLHNKAEGFYMVASAEISPRASLGRNDVIFFKRAHKVPFRGIATARQKQSLLAMT